MDYKGAPAFTFTWKIKKLSSRLDRSIKSPKFIVEALNKTEWHIEFFPGNYYADAYVGCCLKRDDDSNPECIDVDFEISLVTNGENTSENVHEIGFPFKKGESFTCKEFALHSSLFRKYVATFEICCRIWSRGPELVGTDKCFVCTEMYIKKRIRSTWTIEDISSLLANPSHYISFSSKPIDEGSSITFEVILNHGTYSPGIYRVRGIRLNVKSIDSEEVYCVVSDIHVLNTKGKKVWSDFCSHFTVREGKSDYEFHLPFYFSKHELTAVFPGDVLNLSFEFKIYAIHVYDIEYK